MRPPFGHPDSCPLLVSRLLGRSTETAPWLPLADSRLLEEMDWSHLQKEWLKKRKTHRHTHACDVTWLVSIHSQLHPEKHGNEIQILSFISCLFSKQKTDFLKLYKYVLTIKAASATLNYLTTLNIAFQYSVQHSGSHSPGTSKLTMKISSITQENIGSFEQSIFF